MAPDELTYSRRAALLSASAAVGSGLIPTRLAAQEATPAVGSGGTLRVAINGNGTVETLDPADPSSNLAWARINAAYDPLVRIANNGFRLELLESIEPNEDASIWRARLRTGIRFHDGQPLTADDVIYTFTTHPSPFALAYFPLLANIDPAKTVAISETELDLALLTPVGALLDNLTTLAVIRAGTTIEELQTGSNGTGPFRLESFTPGGTATFVRNPDYWASEGVYPLLDGLELTQINESPARLNALLADQIDVATALGSAEIVQVEQSDEVSLLTAGPGTKYTPGLVLRVDRPPFDNPDVRRAVKLAIDRQQILDTIGAGRGRLGVDTFVADGLYFNRHLQPLVRDVETARAIITEAGLEGTTIDILTAPVDAGLVEMATLFAASLEEIGLKAEVEVAPAETFWVNMGSLADATVKSMVSGVNSVLEYAAFSYPPGAVFNLSGYDNPAVTDLIARATASASFDERLALMAEMQEILSADGPDLVPAILDANHAVRAGVTGVEMPESDQFLSFVRAQLTR